MSARERYELQLNVKQPAVLAVGRRLVVESEDRLVRRGNDPSQLHLVAAAADRG